MCPQKYAVAAIWKALTEEQKAKYHEMAVADKARYTRECHEVCREQRATTAAKRNDLLFFHLRLLPHPCAHSDTLSVHLQAGIETSDEKRARIQAEAKQQKVAADEARQMAKEQKAQAAKKKAEFGKLLLPR